MCVRPIVSLAVAAIGLSACGGASTGPAPIAEYAELGDALLDRLDASDRLDPADLVVAGGTATYEGLIGLGPGAGTFEDAYAISEMTLSVSLVGDSVRGRASEFYAVSSGDRLAGDLSLEANLDRDPEAGEYAVVGTLDGTLEGASGDEATIDIPVEADFYGDNGQFIDGFGDGDAVFADPDQNVNMSVTFIAGRQ